MSSRLPVPAPAKTKVCFSPLADQLLPLLKQQKALEAKLEDLKKKARELARQERTSPDIDSVEIRGQPNISVLVTFVANKTSFVKGTELIDMRRLQGLAGEGVITVSSDVKLNDGVTFSRARSEVGEELFNKLFKPVHVEKINGAEFDAWVHRLSQTKTASEDDAARQTLDLVKRVTVSREETPRVSGF